MGGDGEAKAQLIATQEEENKNANGGGGSAGSTDTSDSLGSAVDSSSTTDNSDSGSNASSDSEASGPTQLSGSAFDYVQSTLFKKGGNVGYAPVKTAISSGDRQSIRNAVLATFFIDPTNAEQATSANQMNARRQRDAYVQEASARHITLASRVKGHIQNDLSAISSAPLAGDGEVGGIAVDTHTLEQAIKMEMVDLALQIEMMEADAIQFMMDQPVALMGETKPTITTDEGE